LGGVAVLVDVEDEARARHVDELVERRGIRMTVFGGTP
jgi:hypothetical protein